MADARFVIRPYREADEVALIDLWRAAFSEEPPWNDPATDIRRKLGVQRELFLVAEIDAALAGAVMAGFDGHRGWIHRMSVAALFRRRGLGRALMEAAERRLREIGCSKINLQVRASNQEVVAFYASLGYSIEERISMGKGL